MLLLPQLLTITMLTSIMFMFLKHPLTLGLMLILQTLLICSTSALLMPFSWFSYILFMIFLGALLVLFIYVASLAPNEMIYMSNNLMTMTAITLTMTPILLFQDQLILLTKTSTETSSISQQQIFSSPLSELSMIYSPPISNITVFVIIYLLLTLLIVVKLTSTFHGPLRLS